MLLHTSTHAPQQHASTRTHASTFTPTHAPTLLLPVARTPATPLPVTLSAATTTASLSPSPSPTPQRVSRQSASPSPAPTALTRVLELASSHTTDISAAAVIVREALRETDGVQGGDITLMMAPPKRKRGRPRKDAPKHPDAQASPDALAAALTHLITASCTSLASSPNTFDHPSTLAHALHDLHQLSSGVQQLLQRIGTPSVGVAASLESGLTTLMSAAPEVFMHNSSSSSSSSSSSTPKATHVAAAHANASQPEAMHTADAVRQAVSAVQQGSVVGYYQAVWAFMQAGMSSHWPMELHMDGAATFLRLLTDACTGNITGNSSDGSNTMNSSITSSTTTDNSSSSTTNTKSRSKSSSVQPSPSPLSSRSPTPHRSASATPSPETQGHTQQHTLNHTRQHTLNHKTPSFLLPTLLADDLADPEAQQLWMRVCCDIFAAPVHCMKASQARQTQLVSSAATVYCMKSLQQAQQAQVMQGAQQSQGTQHVQVMQGAQVNGAVVERVEGTAGRSSEGEQGSQISSSSSGKSSRGKKKGRSRSKSRSSSNRKSSASVDGGVLVPPEQQQQQHTGVLEGKSDTQQQHTEDQSSTQQQHTEGKRRIQQQSDMLHAEMAYIASLLHTMKTSARLVQQAVDDARLAQEQEQQGINHTELHSSSAHARCLVLAAAAYNRACKAGLRHRDCFVVTQAWVDAVVAPALRSLSQPTPPSSAALLERLTAAALGLSSSDIPSSNDSASGSVSSSKSDSGSDTDSRKSSSSENHSIDQSSSAKASNSSNTVSGSSNKCSTSPQEMQALLGALRELKGSSSWAVPTDALACLDEALLASGACRLHEQGDTQATLTALHTPPTPPRPLAHLLSSSRGMLHLVFGVGDEGEVQQETQQGGDAVSSPAPLDDATELAAPVNRASCVVQLLKARASLGRGVQCLPSLPLMSAAADCIIGAADKVSCAHMTGGLACLAWEEDGSADAVPVPTAVNDTSADVADKSAAATDRIAADALGLPAVIALQGLLGLLADHRQSVTAQQPTHEQHTTPTLSNQPEQTQQQKEQSDNQQKQLASLDACIAPALNKLYLCLAFLPDSAWHDTALVTHSYPRLLQLCVSDLGQRADLLQPDRWVEASLAMLQRASSLNVDALIGLARAARLVPPHFLILDPGSHATVSAGTPAASAASSQTVPTSWWQTLDAAVANAVEGAAAVAFISPQRWVKLLHILSEAVQDSASSSEPISFPATVNAVSTAATTNTDLFGGFGQRAQDSDDAPAIGGTANLNGEIGMLLGKLSMSR